MTCKHLALSTQAWLKETLWQRCPHKASKWQGIWGRNLPDRNLNSSKLILVHWRTNHLPVAQDRQLSFPSNQLWVLKAYSALSSPQCFIFFLSTTENVLLPSCLTITSNEFDGSLKHPHVENLSLQNAAFSPVVEWSTANIHSLMQWSSKWRTGCSQFTYNHTLLTQD